MAKFITVKIPEPDISGLNKQEIKMYVQLIAEDLAQQIMDRVIDAKRQAEILYWRQLLLQWEIEDYHTQLKYDIINEQARINTGSTEVDSEKESKDHE
jgi:hypothetical protein